MLTHKLREQNFELTLKDLELKASRPLADMLDVIEQRIFYYRDALRGLAQVTLPTNPAYQMTHQAAAAIQSVVDTLHGQLKSQATATYSVLLAEQIEVLPQHVPVREKILGAIGKFISTLSFSSPVPKQQTKDFVLNNGRRQILLVVPVNMWPMVKMRATLQRKALKKSSLNVDGVRVQLVVMDDLFVKRVGDSFDQI